MLEKKTRGRGEGSAETNMYDEYARLAVGRCVSAHTRAQNRTQLSRLHVWHDQNSEQCRHTSTRAEKT